MEQTICNVSASWVDPLKAIHQRRQLVFKVTNKATQNDFCVFSNGDIEGFGQGLLIFDYIQALISEVYDIGYQAGSESLRMSGRDSESNGAAHGSAR